MKDNKKNAVLAHMILADNCYLFAASKEEVRKMIVDTTEEL